MRNITIQVTDDIYHHARIAASARNMSVSALFRALILTLEKQPDPNNPDGARFQKCFPAIPDPNFEMEAFRASDQHQQHLNQLISKYECF